MMFQTHAVVGYLLGVVGRIPTLAAVAGSLLPDLVDRPLCWVGLTPDDHTVAHSLLVAVPGSLLATGLFGRRGTALAAGWLCHIAGDVLNVTASQGPRVAPSYVLYPLTSEGGGDRFPLVSLPVPVVDDEHTVSPVVLALEATLTCWAALVWWRESGLAAGVRARL